MLIAIADLLHRIGVVESCFSTKSAITLHNQITIEVDTYSVYAVDRANDFCLFEAEENTPMYSKCKCIIRCASSLNYPSFLAGNYYINQTALVPHPSYICMIPNSSMPWIYVP